MPYQGVLLCQALCLVWSPSSSHGPDPITEEAWLGPSTSATSHVTLGTTVSLSHRVLPPLDTGMLVVPILFPVYVVPSHWVPMMLR